jgi:hypothetical protein
MKTITLYLILLVFTFSFPSYSTVPDSVIISHTYSGEDDDNPAYHLHSRNETHLDSTGRTSYLIIQNWNGQQFTGGYKNVYNYDSLGRNYETIRLSKNGTSWVNVSRTFIYYNAFQETDSSVVYNWANGNWETQSGMYYMYDANQHLVFSDNGTYKVYYWPDSASHDTLVIHNQFVANTWRDTYKYQHAYDSLGRKVSTVFYNYSVFDSAWNKHDSTSYQYYANDSLYMSYKYYWYDSTYILENVDSLVYSNDTMYVYHGDEIDSTGFPIYEYRDVYYTAPTQYFSYQSEWEYWDGSQWTSGGEYSLSTYDSSLNIAHSHWSSSGSWGNSDSYFDPDGHLINNIYDGYIHAADRDVHSDTYYYYYLTNGDPGICPGTMDSLWVDTGMISYLWNNGDTLNYSLVSTGGLYFCNLVNQYGHPFQSEPHYQYVSLNPTAPREPDSSITSCGWDHFHLTAPNLPIYTYQWLLNDTAIPGQNNSEIEFWLTFYAPMITGDYRLVVTNECGNDTSSTTHITFHIPDVNITPDSGYVYLCPGDTVVLMADSGFTSYLWNTGDTMQTVFSTPGHINNHLTVQDINGCPDYEEVNIEEAVNPNYLPLTIVDQDSILQSSYIDYRPYYQWFLNGVAIPGEITQQLYLQQSGFYKFQYTIAGCMFESAEEYFEYDSFRMIIPQNPVNKCANQILVLGSNFYQLHGGTGPFHYSWSPSAGLSNDTVAAPGCSINSDIDYILTVTDSVGNIATDTLNVVVNTPQSLDISAIYNSICTTYYGGPNIDTLKCNTVIDGYYRWFRNGSIFSSGINKISTTTNQAGQYWMDVSNGCINYSDTITITAIASPPVPVIHFVSIPSDWCVIDSIAIVAEISNPELYNFAWSLFGDYDIPNDTIYLPDARWAFVKISDSLGCTIQASHNFTLDVSDTIVPLNLIPDGLVTACLGDTIELNATNYSNYNYVWTNYNNDQLSTGSYCDVIYSGHYFVEANNGFGCHNSDSVYISFNQNSESVQIIYDGYFLVATSSQYTNQWQWYLNDTLIPGATNSFYHPVEQGNYEAVATTGACGSGIDSFLVNCAVGIIADHISCNQACDGSASINITGGGLSTILWSTGDSTSIIQNLCPGIYWVQVTDSSACFASDTIVLTEPDALLMSSSVTMNLCYQSCDGIIQSLPSGGTQPYSYLWSTGQSTVAIDSLCAGIYSLQISDAEGCVSSDTIELTEPAALLSTPSINMNACYQSCDGMIVLNASGGMPPYSYLWSTNETTSAVDSLCAGSYSYILTDSNGCTLMDSLMISEPSEIILDDSVTNASCAVCPDGSVIVSISGGSPPYTVLWSTGDTTSGLVNVLPGDYSICISDSAGCMLCDTFTVSMMVGSIQSVSASSIKVFPNPGNHELNVIWNSDQKNEKAYLSLRNDLGDVVTPAILFESQVSIDISTLPNGVYLLELRKDNSSELMQLKVVVVH